MDADTCLSGDDSSHAMPRDANGRQSFCDALCHKYLDDGFDIDSGEVSIFGRYDHAQLQQELCQVPPNVVLDCAHIDDIDEESAIRSHCEHVREIDVSHNHLSSWAKVERLLRAMDRLNFMNLSFNPLCEPIACPLRSSSHGTFASLKQLVLNGTKTPWPTVVNLLHSLPSLKQLDACLNDYSDLAVPSSAERSAAANRTSSVSSDGDSMQSDSASGSPCEYSDAAEDDDDARVDFGAFPALESLNIDSNAIADPSALLSVGRLFPQLEVLYLSENPLADTASLPPEAIQKHFPKVRKINLNYTKLNSWRDVETLSHFSALQEVRLRRIPLLDSLNEEDGRHHVIARLPERVSVLNGSAVTQEERDSAERAFMRAFMYSPAKPKRYSALEEKHGKLLPLADVDLSAPDLVRMSVRCGSLSKTLPINVKQTVRDLKKSLQDWTGVSPSKQRLFYVDAVMSQLHGPEEMRYPTKNLYTYCMQDGDEILVERKG